MIARKRATARTWRCPHCLGRTTARTCPCGIRKGTKRTSLKARADALARALCRKLADGKCARCGGPGTDWAHRMPRRHYSVRWDVEGNSDFLCRPCHRYFTDNPFEFSEWLENRIGKSGLKELGFRANLPWDKDYNRVLASLTEKRKEET